MDQPSTREPNALPGGPSDDPYRLVGRTVTRYRVLDGLGGGGMGVVYRAEDTRLGRQVALKFLPPAWRADAAAEERFLREAQAASVLDHPHIVPLYEIGETDEGQLFIVMAYCEGETLEQKLSGGPLPVEEAVEITMQVARGLAHAHAQDILHRDIKPANIIVTAEGQARIVDFGIAKIRDSTFTKTGAILGTMAYMSPEQARGEAVDHRTDIFSLGVLLYVMLTGKQPFRGAYEQAVFYALLHEDPDPVTALRPEVPESLAQVVTTMLNKRPAERYDHMNALLTDLQEVQQRTGTGTVLEDTLRPVAASVSTGAPAAPAVRQEDLSRKVGTAPAEAPAGPIKILVVDDEPDLELLIRQRFRRRLRERELELLFAADGLEALEVLSRREDVDIVLTDINMPRMDGLSLLGRISEMERVLKVVIVSAYGDMENIRTAMNRGAFDFITKPIDFEDLEITLEKTHGELLKLKAASALQQQLNALHCELEIASKIQLSTLPCTFPAFPERTDFDLYAMMMPAQEVGGDFYDFFLIDDDHLGFVLGDVSGKGVGAAMFMAITRTMLRATALQHMTPDACVRHVNRVLYPESMPRMFVTLVYGILDTRTGEVTYCNAGHNLPYLVRSSEQTAVLERTEGVGLCLKGEHPYEARSVTLQPGDSLFLYTDGVTEATNREREQFSEARLLACLEQARGKTPAKVIRDVLRSVEDFAGGTSQADDITLLAMQYLG